MFLTRLTHVVVSACSVGHLWFWIKIKKKHKKQKQTNNTHTLSKEKYKEHPWNFKRRGFAPGFVNYKKECTRLAAASDKVY